ncbi:MAG TPA: NUDIX domain-containing protein [Devosia sp.]|nr:NUDIX domain-containing protein [Devosia sp.]
MAERNRWQQRRTAAYLFAMGLRRRMTLGARIALVEGDRVYLIRHTYVPGWHFPGGGIEPGESVELGVARELSEESAYRLTARPELFGLYHNVSVTNRDHVAFYIGRQFEEARGFAPNFEIAEFGWFDWRALPAGASEATRRRVAEMFEGVEKAELW